MNRHIIPDDGTNYIVHWNGHIEQSAAQKLHNHRQNRFIVRYWQQGQVNVIREIAVLCVGVKNVVSLSQRDKSDTHALILRSVKSYEKHFQKMRKIRKPA